MVWQVNGPKSRNNEESAALRALLSELTEMLYSRRIKRCRRGSGSLLGFLRKCAIHESSLPMFGEQPAEARYHSLHLNLDLEVPDDRERYPVDIVRQYLANARTREAMALEAFDALLNISDRIEGEPSEIIDVAPLKEIVRSRTTELTELIEATGEFLVTGELMVALIEVGHVSSELGRTDYGDLQYRTASDRPWLMTSVKFAGETDHLDRDRSEFLAYYRIITGK